MLSMVLGLARLGLLGFGGVGPQAYSFFVEQTAWLHADEFAELYSLAQALPGANVVNLCAILGDRWYGPLGALAAVAAITLPPLALVLCLAVGLAHVTRAPRLIAAECGVVVASAGLILATAFRVVATATRRRLLMMCIVISVAFVVTAHVLSMPLATVLGVALGIACDVGLRGQR